MDGWMDGWMDGMLWMKMGIFHEYLLMGWIYVQTCSKIGILIVTVARVG